MSKKYYYKALVTRVVDGDTMDMDVDVGFGITSHQRFRIKDYDAPETWRPKTDMEERHGTQAKLLAIQLLDGIIVDIESFKADLYGRYTVNITLPDGRDFAEVMIASGMSKRQEY